MRRLIFGGLLLIFCGGIRSYAAGAAGGDVDSNQAATGLVAAALHSEAAGHNAERQRLLQQAIAERPDYAPARWQAGYVRYKDQWLTVDDAVKAAEGDPVRRQYYELRTKTSDDIAGNLALGIWCREHKLAAQARAHLMRVLVFDYDNPRARALLGFRREQGTWRSEESTRQQAMDAKWSQKIKYIRGRLQSGSRAAQKSASEELLAIRDPEAIGPLGRILAGTNPQMDEELVEVFDRMEGPSPTAGMLQLALASPFPTVRALAASRLKNRDADFLVPMLLEAMWKPGEIKHDFRQVGSYSTVIIWRRTFAIERGDRVDTVVDDWVHLTTPLGDAAPIAEERGSSVREAEAKVESDTRAWLNSVPKPKIDERANLGRTLSAAAFASLPPPEAKLASLLMLESTHFDDQIKNASRDWNSRVADVLRALTGQRLPPEPKAWWDWWVSESALSASASYPAANRYNPGHTLYRSSATADWTCEGFGGAGGVGGNIMSIDAALTCCFVAGTRIQTIDGPRPIEQVRLGDLVLSQNSETGELAFKPVLDTTVQPARKLCKLTAGDETIQCTGGHPIWVDGTGWVPAQELADGSYLHGFRGAIALWKRGEGAVAPTYNLVVADFNTYFVCKEGILVHDNTIHRPAEAAVPGLAR